MYGGMFIILMAVAGLSFAVGKWFGYCDAQPKRDKTGRFKKRER